MSVSVLHGWGFVTKNGKQNQMTNKIVLQQSLSK